MEQFDDRIEQNGDRMVHNEDRIEQNGDRIEQLAHRIEQNGDRMIRNEDKIERNEDRIECFGDRIECFGVLPVPFYRCVGLIRVRVSRGKLRLGKPVCVVCDSITPRRRYYRKESRRLYRCGEVARYAGILH